MIRRLEALIGGFLGGATVAGLIARYCRRGLRRGAPG